jgi:hypothetical protein
VKEVKQITEVGFLPTQDTVVPMQAERELSAKIKKVIRGKAASEERKALRSLYKVPSRITSQPKRATTLIAGEISETALEELRQHKAVADVYDDPEVAPFPTVIDCDAKIAKGSAAAVAKYLGAADLNQLGFRGTKIGIGICDTGVNKAHIPVTGGWTPNPGIPVGVDAGPFPHGSMTAFDARSMAPRASIYDIGVLKPSPTGGTFLSTALQGFQWAIDSFQRIVNPKILSNSWGIYQEASQP